MTTSAFPILAKAKSTASSPEDTVLRDFSGGLRIVENDVVLRSKFAVEADNVFLSSDFSPTVRWGTKKFAQNDAGEIILDQYYFKNVILSFTSAGTVYATNDAGVTILIWSPAIAAALPGAPTGWSTVVETISFSEMNGALTVQNNIDKPIRIRQDLSVIYEQDDASLTNINTPIARFTTTVNDFAVVALDSDDAEIIISSKGTSGVWPGDTPPNNSTVFALGAYVQERTARIQGLFSFTNTLVVIFESSLLFVELGIFDVDGVHTPRVVDILEDIQSVSHKLLAINNTKMLMMTASGVVIVSKNNLTQKFSSKGISDAVNPLLVKKLPAVVDPEKCFTVIDVSEQRQLFFLDQGTAEPFVLCMTYDENLTNFVWTTMSAMPYTSGCKSLFKRVFFSNGAKIFQYGNSIFSGEDYTKDMIGDSGEAKISFAWESSWLDFNDRLKTKQLFNVLLDAFGGAAFFVSLFTDKFYKNAEGVRVPAVQMLFLSEGVGHGIPSEGYGAGRSTRDQSMYRLPIQFKLLKLRVEGSIDQRLSWSSIGMIYKKLRYNR